MKKIIFLLVAVLVTGYGVFSQHTFPAIPGPVLVTSGSGPTLPLNDAGNSAAVPAGNYADFTVTVDWTDGGGGPWSSEARLTMNIASGSTAVLSPISGGASNANPTTLTFSGSFPSNYNPTVDGTMSISLEQSFGGSSGNWSNIVVSITPPLVVSPPTTEDFATTATPPGWNITGWTIGSVRGVTGNPGNNLYKNIYEFVPTGTFTSVTVGPVTSDMVFSFDYTVALFSSPHAPPAAGSGNFVLEVSTDFGNTYSVVEIVANNGVAGWQSKSYPLTSFAGQNVKFKITGNWISEDWDMAFDNFVVEVPPPCLVASDVVFSNILHNTANVSWTASPDGTDGYNWVVMNEGDVPGTDAPVSSGSTTPGVTSTTVSGLNELTNYEFYVQTNCGLNGLSLWLGPNTFQTVTDCSIYTLSVSATGGGVCYEGSATLTATGGGDGSDIFWYDAAMGGNLIGSGPTFNTPIINTSSSYWAAEVVHGGILPGQAFANPPSTLSNSTSNAGGLIFTVNNPIIIVDVEVFSTNATSGDITIELRDIGNGNATIASTTASITGGGTGAAPISQIITLNFAVPSAGNYRLVRSGSTASVGMGNVLSAGTSFPYPLGSSGQVTGGSTLASTSTTHFFFYNWTIIEAALCESTREEAIATVYDFIPVEASATETSIDPGDSTTLNATSTNANYTYAWTWDGGGPLAGASVNVSPSTNTTYTVTATDSITGCVATDEITILVFDTSLCDDLEITSVDGAFICDEGTAILTATAAGISGHEIYWYDVAVGGNRVGTGTTFETPVLTQTTSYWVAEVLEQGGSISGQGKVTYDAATTGNSTSGANWGLVFVAYEAFTIQDVEIYSTGNGGDITIQLQDNTGAMIQQVIVNIPGGGTPTAPVPYTAVLNLDVPVAGTYRLIRTSSNPSAVNMIRETTGNTFPYPLGSVGSITSGYISGTSTTYYWFYNWTVTTALVLCESDREEVIATVVDIIDVEASASQTSIDPVITLL